MIKPGTLCWLVPKPDDPHQPLCGVVCTVTGVPAADGFYPVKSNVVCSCCGAKCYAATAVVLVPISDPSVRDIKTRTKLPEHA